MTNREAINEIKLLRGFKSDLSKKERNQYTAKKYREEIESLDMAIAALRKQEREKWHPVNADDPGSCPDSDRIILVTFSNAPGVIDSGIYLEDELGGCFYSIDRRCTFTQHGLFVCAWREFPDAYEEGKDE